MSVRTGRGSRLERASAAACAVAVEVGGFVCVDPLTVHLVRLSGFLQLGQDQTAAALRRSIHLKHLGRPERTLGSEDNSFTDVTVVYFEASVP